jgi:hypothetical protein
MQQVHRVNENVRSAVMPMSDPTTIPVLPDADMAQPVVFCPTYCSCAGANCV